MSYYTQEAPNQVVYTTTSYNVNPTHQKGRNRIKLFPRFSRKRAAPQPLVVDHSVKVTQSGYGGVVYPSGYNAERYQISTQSPGISTRSNSLSISNAYEASKSMGSDKITYYESNYTPNTFNHEKYYAPPPPISSYEATPVRSSRVQCQPVQTDRLRSYQQQNHQHHQQQQYHEDSNLLNTQQHNSYGGTNSSSANGKTTININNNVTHHTEDYNSYNQSTNNNYQQQQQQQQQQQYNQPPPSNVENFIYPPGYLENQHSFEYHQESHQQQNNHQQQQQYSNQPQYNEPVYPPSIEHQNWSFDVHNISDPYGNNNNY